MTCDHEKAIYGAKAFAESHFLANLAASGGDF